MSQSTSLANEIIERFWANEIAKCSLHSLPLKLRFRKLLGGDYELSADCSLCGKNGVFRRGDDPRRSRFRPWTALEIDDLTKRALSGNITACPVCGATIETHPLAKDTAAVLIRCLRCGGSNQWQPIFSGVSYGSQMFTQSR